MTRPVAKSVKSGKGFKALVVYEDGRTHRPPVKQFGNRTDATAYAERWIASNYEGRAESQAEAHNRRERKLNALVAHIAAGGRW